MDSNTDLNTLADAARVCAEGETGLRQGLASGRLASSTDRDGREMHSVPTAQEDHA